VSSRLVGHNRSLLLQTNAKPSASKEYRHIMQLNNKNVIVTGGGSGIGKALCTAFAKAGATVAVADIDESAASAVAAQIDGISVRCDVTREPEIENLVNIVQDQMGPVDLFCSNAGVCFGEPGHAASASNDVWQTCWQVHVMAHVYAARAVLPSMLERGSGYFLQMSSAAGLLSLIGDAAYSTTKHAAVGLAESLAITHADDGINVSVVCPQYVATPMLGYAEGDPVPVKQSTITPQQVADAVLKGIDEETFLILPHPEIAGYLQSKTANYDQWLGGMQKLRRKMLGELGTTDLVEMHKLIM